MIDRIIEICVKNRLLVLLIAAVVAVFGVRALLDTPLDAIPDLSDVQVIIFTEYMG